jgi:mono/diheme cytochrome c family protein
LTRAVSMRVVLTALALALTAPTVSLAGPVTSAPDPAYGKVLAERLCSNCHLVSSAQEQVNVDVPSFHEIGNLQSQTEGSIMAKIVMPKHSMPVIPITKSELEDLAAYIMSLRDQETE